VDQHVVQMSALLTEHVAEWRRQLRLTTGREPASSTDCKYCVHTFADRNYYISLRQEGHGKDRKDSKLGVGKWRNFPDTTPSYFIHGSLVTNQCLPCQFLWGELLIEQFLPLQEDRRI